MIEVSDDGCGMSPEEAAKSVLVHWTSKINKVEDLDHLESFGFRGEALASISSVSNLAMTTRSRDTDDPGTRLDFKFGTLEGQSQVAASFGTTISVTDLFGNTPARKKFLKQNETEFNQVFGLIQQFALANKDVSFSVHKDGKMFLNAPRVDDLKNRVCQLWDYNLSGSLVELSGQADGVKISGLISDGSASRYSKSGIFLLVNGRPVKDQKISRAILNGYQERMPEGRFPVCFVFVEADPTKIDVNIHPRKEQVRFSAYGLVCSSVKEAVKQSLEAHVSSQISTAPIQAAFKIDQNLYQPSQAVETKVPEAKSEPGASSELGAHFLHGSEKTFTNSEPSQPQDTWQEKLWTVETPAKVAEPINFTPELSGHTQSPSIPQAADFGKIIGQLMSTFILIEKTDGLVIVDQHAAHERILYERMKLGAKTVEGTRLLFPELITLDQNELEALLTHKSIFAKFGIELDKFSKTQAVLSSSPCSMSGADATQIIKSCLPEIATNQKLDAETVIKKLSENLHAQIACKAAIKAGDPMDQQSMEQLLSDLEATPNRFQCIHGRPTIWKIEKSRLYKEFERPFKG